MSSITTKAVSQPPKWRFLSSAIHTVIYFQISHLKIHLLQGTRMKNVLKLKRFGVLKNRTWRQSKHFSIVLLWIYGALGKTIEIILKTCLQTRLRYTWPSLVENKCQSLRLFTEMITVRMPNSFDFGLLSMIHPNQTLRKATFKDLSAFSST